MQSIEVCILLKIGTGSEEDYMTHSFTPISAVSSRCWFRTIGNTLAIALGLGAALIGTSSAVHASEVPSLIASPVALDDAPVIQDGVYLYGQSPQPEQIGVAYMIFEAQSDRIVGAFYMPHSSFDCFYGNAQPDRLALTVIDSYEQEAYTYNVAMQANADIASVVGGAVNPVALEGFHPIEPISDNDQRILGVCQTNYVDRI